MSLFNTIHDVKEDERSNPAYPQLAIGNGRSVKLRRQDRRPKSEEKLDKRSISLSPRLNALLRLEHRRLGYPSVAALIEDAIATHVARRMSGEAPANPVDEGGMNALLQEVRQLGRRLHALERETAERDVIATEMLAGFVRAYFAMTPPPETEGREARLRAAEAQFERYLNAVGRKIESGDTTLRQLPEVTFDARPCANDDASETAVAHQREEIFAPGGADAGAN